jgi:hypothetical protein
MEWIKTVHYYYFLTLIYSVSWESEIEGLINQGDTTFLEEDNISNLYFTQFVTLNEESTVII